MAEDKKYLNYAGLRKYDQLIKDYIADADEKVIEAVKDGATYTFTEGAIDGAFSVRPAGGNEQSIKIHGLRSFCYGSDVQGEEDELVFDCGTASDMLPDA